MTLTRLHTLLNALPAIPLVGREELDRHNREAHLRVARSSNAFLRKLLNTWITVATVLCIYLAFALPEVLNIALLTLVSALTARIAVHRRAMLWARWLFIAPVTVAFFFMAPAISGIRTPILINVPLFILLYGWLFGRRVMAFMAALFALGMSLMWIAEYQGWWIMSGDIRAPQVWFVTWMIAICLTTLTAGALISSYQAHSRSEVALRGELATVLHFTETLLLRSPLPMRLFDALGRCTKVNEAYAQLVGVPRDLLLTQNLHELGMWQESGLADDCRAALTSLQPLRRELSVHTSTGFDLWLDVHLLPLESAGQRSLLVQMINLTERKQMSEALESMAFHDALTGLPNRRLFFDHFDLALHKARRAQVWGAVLLLDLNRFKDLNDRCGHEAGDLMLCEVARRLKGALRESDTAARLGGDEFAVLAEDLGDDEATARNHAERLAAKLHEVLSHPYQLGSIHHQASASVGYELFSAVEQRDSNAVLHAADVAMYAAKRARGPHEHGTDSGESDTAAAA